MAKPHIIREVYKKATKPWELHSKTKNTHPSQTRLYYFRISMETYVFTFFTFNKRIKKKNKKNSH